MSPQRPSIRVSRKTVAGVIAQPSRAQFLRCLIICAATATTSESGHIVARTPSNRLFSTSSTHLPAASYNKPFHHVPSLSSPIRLAMSSSSASSSPAGDDVVAVSSSDPLGNLGLPRPLILGSGSFTRKLILKEMGVNFVVIKRPIDEKSLGDRADGSNPEELVLTLAKAKLDHLVNELKSGRCDEDLAPAIELRTKLDGGQGGGDSSSNNWIVLTGDQVVTHDGSILEKPRDVAEAKDFVSRYAHSPPSTVGSCVLCHVPSGIQVAGVDTATIVFRPSVAELDDNGKDLIDQLVEDEDAPVLDCAGGLMVEHPLTREHLDRIEGTEDSVMGLSKDLVLRLLNELKEKLAEAE